MCLNSNNRNPRWGSYLYDLCFPFLQGANELAKPPTLTEIYHSCLKNSESKDDESGKQKIAEEPNQGLKRKFDSSQCSEDQGEESKMENDQDLKNGKLKKAKNVGISFCSASFLHG